MGRISCGLDGTGYLRRHAAPGHGHGTVSKPYHNPIVNNDWSCRSSEEQIPQIVENNKNRVEIWEPKEAYYSLHTQVVLREI